MLPNNKFPLWVIRTIVVVFALSLLVIFFFGSYSGLGSSL